MDVFDGDYVEHEELGEGVVVRVWANHAARVQFQDGRGTQDVFTDDLVRVIWHADSDR